MPGQLICMKGTMTASTSTLATVLTNVASTTRTKIYGLIVHAFIDWGTMGTSSNFTLADDTATAADLLNGQGATTVTGGSDTFISYQDIGGAAAYGTLTCTVSTTGATGASDIYVYVMTPRRNQ